MAICHVVRLGRIAYPEALELQLGIVGRLKAAEPGDAVLLLLEHEPVITIGRSGGADHLLASRDELACRGIALVDSGRGGDVTYHGPGQLVGYPLLRLPEHRRDVHRYLRDLEAVLIAALARFGIQGRRVAGYTGVWVGEEKVAAIGVAFSRWVAYHGFALNVATDLAAFDLIVPCGIADKPVTSLERLLGRAAPWREVEAAVVEAFVHTFGFDAAHPCRSVDDLPPTLR